MKVKLFVLFIFTFFNLKAQNDCTILIDPNQPLSASTPCFNVDSIYNNCITIYIKVNVHFFVKDNCSGSVTTQQDPNQVKQESASGWANYMIYQANLSLANNLPQSNANGYNTSSSAPHCNPIRYVLSGVYFHCNEADKYVGFSIGYLNSKYGVNVNSELNIFIASFNHNTGSGVAYLGGSTSSINRLDFGLLNHELAHNFDLDHSWEQDECDDTPNLTFQWDKNCNGIIDTDVNNDETNFRCWELEPSNSAKCNPNPPCTVYPCCDPGWINNNITAYNNPNGAWTDCQIRRALNNIASLKCEMIAQIGGNCPPPSAFIARLPQDIVKQKHCSFCFDLEASTNYNQYKIEVYDNLNPSNPILIRSTNFINGLAKKYCISGSFLSSQWQDGMQPNHPYLIKLTVKNDCCETSKSFPFVLPTRNCTIDPDYPRTEPFKFFNLSPNPANDYINIEYQLEEAAQVSIQLIGALGFYNSINVVNNENQLTGTNYSYNVNIQSLPLGVNSIVVQGGNYLYSYQFIKQ